MSLTAKVVSVDVSRRQKAIKLRVTPAGNYPTGGDVIDFTAATNPNALPGAYPTRVPTVDQVECVETLNGCDQKYVAGTTLANGKIKVFTASDTEHANGAYSADELADSFDIVVRVPIFG